MKGALICCLVAQIKRELLLVVAGRQFVIECDVLQDDCPLAEPDSLRHFVDQDHFGEAGRFVLVAQAAEQHVELVLAFPGKNGESTGEAVAEIIASGNGFAFRCFRTGGMPSVGFDWLQAERK